jgi:chromosome segregation ATPase
MRQPAKSATPAVSKLISAPKVTEKKVSTEVIKTISETKVNIDIGFGEFKTIAEITARLGVLAEQRAKLEKEYNEFGKEIEKALETCKKIKIKEQESYEVILDLQRQQEELLETKRNLEIQLNDREDNTVLATLESVTNSLNKVLHDQEIELEKYKDIMAEIERRIAMFLKHIEEIKRIIAGIDKDIAELERKIAAVKVQIAGYEAKIKELTLVIAKLEAEKKSIEKDQVAITNLIAATRVKIDAEKTIKLKLEQDVQRALDQIAHFKGHIREEEDIIKRLLEEIEAHKKIIALNNGYIEEQQKLILKLKLKITYQEETIQKLIVELKLAIEKSQKIDAALHAKIAEIKAKKEELIVTYGKLKEAEHILSDLLIELEQKKKAKMHELEEIKRHEGLIADAKAEGAAATKAYEAFKLKIKPYIDSYNAAIKQLEEKRKQIVVKKEGIKMSIKATEEKMKVLLLKVEKETKTRVSLQAEMSAAMTKLKEIQFSREEKHHKMEMNEAEVQDLTAQKSIIGDYAVLEADLDAIMKSIKEY